MYAQSAWHYVALVHAFELTWREADHEFTLVDRKQEAEK